MVLIMMSDVNDKLYDKQAIIEGLRKNLNVTVIEFANALQELPENHSCRKIAFSDIFQISSVNSPDECLKELVKHSDEFVENGKRKYLNIKEIEGLLKCDRLIISKTLHLLEMKGGMNGWEILPCGDRRGKKYALCKIE